MAGIVLDRERTALLIADFYEAMRTSIPHPVDRKSVLSTVRNASDLDYNLVVVENCCSDPDAEVQDFLIDRIFPGQAEVVQSAEVVAALAQ